MSRTVTGILLAVAVGVAACARPLVFSKPGLTPEEFARDSYACQHEASFTSTLGVPIVPGEAAYTVPVRRVDGALFVLCMQARGYHLER